MRKGEYVMSDSTPMHSMVIPKRTWDAYSRKRPNDPEPIHVGDKFRLIPGGPLYEIRAISYPAMKPV